jgi:hypothetical protein
LLERGRHDSAEVVRARVDHDHDLDLRMRAGKKPTNDAS